MKLTTSVDPTLVIMTKIRKELHEFFTFYPKRKWAH